MAIVDRHIDPAGLGPAAHNFAHQYIASHKVSTINAVVTRASVFSASSINSTQAPGTAVDYARNLAYQLSVIGGTASSAIISGGSVVVLGSDILGNSLAETVAMTALAAASVPVAGTALFGSVGTVSYRSVSLLGASSSNSSCVSFSIGVGNIVALPQAIRSAGPLFSLGASSVIAYIGTARQSGSATLISGPVGSAGVSFSNGLATNTPIQILFNVNR